LGTFIPSSFSPESIILPEEFKRKKLKIEKTFYEEEKVNKDKAIIKANKDIDKLAKELLQFYRDHDIKVHNIIDSSSRGGIDDIRKMLLSVGLSINAKKEVNDVILTSHTEGLSQTQFFNYSSQGIVALYQKSTDTAIPGYLIRKLYSIMDPVNLSKDLDCGSTKYFKFEIANQDMLSRLLGRQLKNGDIISEEDIEDGDLVGKTVYLRSPLYCQSRDGICKACYGPLGVDMLELKPKDNIGKRSIGSIAEKLVNLTLKSAHTGLSLDQEEVNLIEDIPKFSKK